MQQKDGPAHKADTLDVYECHTQARNMVQRLAGIDLVDENSE